MPSKDSAVIKLPEPTLKGKVTVEEALALRRSIRSYAETPLRLAELSQVLWAAYGTSLQAHGFNLKTAPSAGACYPLELYAVVGNVTGLAPGVYRYDADAHTLKLVASGDRRADLARAALGQRFLAQAPASIAYSAVYERTTRRYGQRGRERYVPMDLGHSAENVYLQCVALGLGTVAVGAFDDAAVKRVIGLPEAEEPLYLMPLGKPGTK